MDVIHSVAWLYQKGGKVLCVRTKNKDKFYIVGGKINQGETPEQALIREVKEELSLDLIPESIKYATTITAEAHGFKADTMVEMQCFYASCLGEGQLSAYAEIAEVKWLGEHDDLTLCAPACLKAIEFCTRSA